MLSSPDRAAWLSGSSACCDRPPHPKSALHRIVLLGAPGVGKGTQAELLSQQLGACHLSTGDIFRAAKTAQPSEGSAAMKAALACMRRGELVSDEIVLAIVAERSKCFHCGGGFLLDGFPRTVAQAEALENILSAQNVALDAVFSYELPQKTVVARLSGRRTCRECKAVFHILARPPAKKGLCDHCGSPLYQRDDDRPESIRIRMEEYRRSTLPLTDLYRSKGLLISIVANGSPEQILARSIEALRHNAANLLR